MLEQQSLITVYPQDDEHSQAIMEEIREKKITDEEKIRALVDCYEFSSPETKRYISDRMVDLLKMGVFDKPPIKIIKIEKIDTDFLK